MLRPLDPLFCRGVCSVYPIHSSMYLCCALFPIPVCLVSAAWHARMIESNRRPILEETGKGKLRKTGENFSRKESNKHSGVMLEEEDDWLRLIEERNRYETYSFMDVCQSSVVLQTRLDHLESLCESYDRQIHEWKEAELERKSNDNSKKEVMELQSKVEKLQDQLNEKIKAEVESAKVQLHLSAELDKLQELATSNEVLMKQLRLDHAQANETIEHLLSHVKDVESTVFKTDELNSNLKDSIEKLQEEKQGLEQLNDSLLGRIVTEKEKQMEELNSMNLMLEHQQKEIEMLRTLLKAEQNKLQQEEQKNQQKEDDRSSSSRNKPSPTTTNTTSGTWLKKWNSSSSGTRSLIPSYAKFTQKAHRTEALCVRYGDQNEDLVVTSGNDGVVRVWDTCNCQLKVAFGATGSTFAGAAPTAATTTTATATGSGIPVLCVDMAGGLVAGGSCDKMCRIWNLKTKRMIHQLVGHGSKVTCLRFSSDAKSIWTGSSDRSIQVWDISRSTYRQRFTLRNESAVFSLDVSSSDNTWSNSMAVSGHLDGGIRFWDCRSSSGSSSSCNSTKPLEAIFPTNARECITSVMLSSSGSQLLSCSREFWSILDLRNAKRAVCTVSHPKVKPSSTSSTSSSALFFSSTASFSPDDRYVVLGSNSTGQVYIWDVQNPSIEKDDPTPHIELSCHTHGVDAVSWGHGGSSCQQLASVDKGGNLILWS